MNTFEQVGSPQPVAPWQTHSGIHPRFAAASPGFGGSEPRFGDSEPKSGDSEPRSDDSEPRSDGSKPRSGGSKPGFIAQYPEARPAISRAFSLRPQRLMQKTGCQPSKPAIIRHLPSKRFLACGRRPGAASFAAHANVMKIFEQVSSTTGSQRDEVISMAEKMNSSANVVKMGMCRFSVAERRAKVAHGETVGIKRKQTKPRMGRKKFPLAIFCRPCRGLNFS
jgi:hypothetical protein